MMTVHEVSELAHVSVRTLHHYDKLGLLRPTCVTEAGYRLYNEQALGRLQMILLFRELRFPLREIRRILDSPDFDRNRALEQQVELLTLQREHTENLITLAKGILYMGVNHIDFTAFDTRKLDDYCAQARAMWGKTDAYKQYEQKSSDTTEEEKQALEEQLMDFFRRLGELRRENPGCPAAQALIAELRAFITAHFYDCTPQMLSYLGAFYGGGGKITERIDQAGGEGTARFVARAIELAVQALQDAPGEVQ